MAAYYHGNSEIHADGLQTLVLTNPGYVGFADPQSAAAHLAFHSPSSAGAANSYSHAPPHFVGHPQDISLHHGLPPRPQYISWNPMEAAAGGGEREGPRPQQQGLSLSLSPQQPARYEAYYGEQEGVSQALAAQVGENLRMPGGSSLAAAASGITNAVSGMQSVLLSSRYLKAAQLLLEEFVNVGSGMKNESAAKRPHGRMVGESSASAADVGDGDKRCPEQSTAGRQEVLMKKAKLVSMLDEVEQRYRQYQQQMQMVIAGFEQMAGIGSAKTYTALALKTISKQFRSLNDAIDGQIAAANRSLGEDASTTTGGKAEGSRLRFVDHQLRQQRALHQLGMIQHSNAWRPQRGLPERAVSVLRAWLFEHFLHPYPKDSDKHMLAKQTGLTRNQVSNWFINARVRLWKPMVEEMYTEEIKEHEQNQSDKTSTSDGFPEKCPIPDNKDGNSTAASVSLAGVTAMASQGSPKRPRTTESRLFASDSPDVDIKPEGQGGNPNDVVWMKFGVDGQSPRQATDEYSANFIGGFGSYPIGEIGRFDAQHFPASFTGSGNAHVNGNVSLTLGLPHCENLPLSGSDRRNYLPNHGIQMVGPGEYGGLSTAAAATVSGFEDLNVQSQKRFAAQLLPDFVA